MAGIGRDESDGAGVLLSAVIIAVLTPAFGHFETVRPTWTRIVRWLAYLAVTGILGATVGRPLTLIWVLGLPAIGAAFHVAWCLRHGINPLTAEPRDRYEELRRHRPAQARP
jgi:hypothetical protein